MQHVFSSINDTHGHIVIFLMLLLRLHQLCCFQSVLNLFPSYSFVFFLISASLLPIHSMSVIGRAPPVPPLAGKCTGIKLITRLLVWPLILRADVGVRESRQQILSVCCTHFTVQTDRSLYYFNVFFSKTSKSQTVPIFHISIYCVFVTKWLKELFPPPDPLNRFFTKNQHNHSYNHFWCERVFAQTSLSRSFSRKCRATWLGRMFLSMFSLCSRSSFISLISSLAWTRHRKSRRAVYSNWRQKNEGRAP